MNYELALSLKNAGFPQKEQDIHGSCEHYGNDEWIKKRNYCGCLVRFPTLSELIEACGDVFDFSLKKNGFDTLLKWSASGGKEYTNHFEVKGSVPEESVANLWLEINKK